MAIGSGAPEPSVSRRRTTVWDDPSISANRARGMSGFEFISGLAAGTIPPPPIALLLGMAVETIERGRAVFTLEVGEHLYNPIGLVHGGAHCAVLDSAMGCAIHSVLPAGSGYTTIELKVNFDRALTADAGVVRAEGEVLTSGRQIATATGRLVSGTGQLYAHATTTCLIFPVAAPG